MAKRKTIGILGGGQLGRMLTQAAHKLGFRVVVLDPTPGSPAAQIADRQIIGNFKNRKKILELGRVSDFITLEIEGVDDAALEELVEEGKPVYPSPKVVRIIKDKFGQKAFLRNKDIPVADFALVENREDCVRQADMFGYPFLLKARFDAYDGRGNFLVKRKSDISRALKKFEGKPLYAEKFVPFTKELAVIAARDVRGGVEAFEVVETIHKNNICHIVRSPAAVPPQTKANAKKLAKKVLAALDGVGVFGIEMFLKKDGGLLINEIAPRVHNSGHHTIESYSSSQFEQHIRAIAGLPLAKPEKRARSAVMVNILGERDGEAKYTPSDKMQTPHGVHVHIYGKMHTRKERKMGHITALGDTVEEAEHRALSARKSIDI